MKNGGVWKQPTGKKRCPKRIILFDGLHRCIRQVGHGGFCGPEIFPIGETVR